MSIGSPLNTSARDGGSPRSTPCLSIQGQSTVVEYFQSSSRLAESRGYFCSGPVATVRHDSRADSVFERPPPLPTPVPFRGPWPIRRCTPWLSRQKVGTTDESPRPTLRSQART